MAEEKKKGLFDRIGDLFSNKDELAKTEEAKRRSAELADQQQKAVKAQVDKQAAAMDASRREAAQLAEKQRQFVQAEVTKKAEEAKDKANDLAEAMNTDAEKVADKYGFAKAAVIATHTVGANETLSHIALRYYGHATPAYYKLIYEFNKDVIGANMNIIRAGQVLEIPQLPPDLA